MCSTAHCTALNTFIDVMMSSHLCHPAKMKPHVGPDISAWCVGPLDPDWRVHVDRVGKRSTER
jgi:hypothetical protein